jgi:hypothetical protein
MLGPGTATSGQSWDHGPIIPLKSN